MDDMEPGGCGAFFALSLVGFIIGFFTGVMCDRVYMREQHWKEIVSRGYAEEIETSAGKVYRWKESGNGQ